MDASMKSFDLMTKSIQTIATEMTDYTKRSVENSTKALEKMVGAKSIDQIVQVQSEYAKAAYEDYFAEATKLGKLCADLGTEAFKPYEGLTLK
jgi:phasin family protein